MKQITNFFSLLMCVCIGMVLPLTSCSDDDDKREYEGVQIVGARIDHVLYLPTYTEGETRFDVPAGKDLSNVKVELLVSNGELAGFGNNTEMDCRKPFAVRLEGYDGKSVDTRVRIHSAPRLVSFIIEGMTIPAEDIHDGAGSLIVQVPKDTDLTALKVTLEFTNGTLMDFQNGVEKDYTDAIRFQVKNVDEETIYTYTFIITTETVGPASVRAICINGVESDYIEVHENELIPYIPALLNFASADVEIEVGFGNKIDEAFTSKGMNLLTGENKVKVTGTNGVVTEFTIGVPQLSFAPLFALTYAELEADGFAANDLTAVGFSGNYVVATNYTSSDKAPVYFDLSGQKQGSLHVTGTTDPAGGHGYRNLATDDTGNILAAHLGTTAGEQWIYRWNSVTSTSEPYISYSKASLGVDYNPRAAGISISGSLDGNAVITVPISQSSDVFVWTVTGGNLNPTPKKYSASLAGNYYWAVQPMPVGTNGYVAFTSGFGDNKSGVTCLNSEMEEIQGLSGMIVTDGYVFKYNDRIYLAYIAFNGTKAIMRFCDITSGELNAYSTPIFQQEMSQTGANGNGTMGTDMAVIDGKLHVAFACTNLGLYVYRFD